jgi:hypothetical protein
VMIVPLRIMVSKRIETSGEVTSVMPRSMTWIARPL